LEHITRDTEPALSLAMPHYLLRVSLAHESFRIRSILCVAELYNFPIKFISEDRFRSILVVELEKDEDAEKLLDRAILIL
jgi:tRNA (guanine10-N2)-methyltransferase